MRRIAFTAMTLVLILITTSAQLGHPFSASQPTVIPTTTATRPVGSIVFTVCPLPYCNDGGQIYIVNADGSGLQSLTRDVVAAQPAWSPDGRKIVYSVLSGDERDRKGQIYVINADGSSPNALTSREETAQFPIWSPDGRYIVYFKAYYRRGFLQVEPFRMNADGTDQRGFGIDDGSLNAAFSPDGKRLVLGEDSGRAANLFIMDTDGANKRALTSDQFINDRPSWSPDSKRLVFNSVRDDSTQIYIINSDGTGLKNLSNSTTDDVAPIWSPDGQRIAFVRDSQLWIMRDDASNTVRITGEAFKAATPWDYCWSPDGEWLVFSARTWKANRDQLFIVNINCSNTPNGCETAPSVLVKDRFGNQDFLSEPDWSPISRK